MIALGPGETKYQPSIGPAGRLVKTAGPALHAPLAAAVRFLGSHPTRAGSPRQRVCRRKRFHQLRVTPFLNCPVTPALFLLCPFPAQGEVARRTARETRLG